MSNGNAIYKQFFIYLWRIYISNIYDKKTSILWIPIISMLVHLNDAIIFVIIIIQQTIFIHSFYFIVISLFDNKIFWNNILEVVHRNLYCISKIEIYSDLYMKFMIKTPWKCLKWEYIIKIYHAKLHIYIYLQIKTIYIY